MNKVLISACLVGEKVRYHGGDALYEHPILDKWNAEGRLIVLCPEVAAGFSTPREPSEITGKGDGNAVLNGTARVTKKDGKDYSTQFCTGAQIASNLAKQHKIKIAILKENSPSCGSHFIYDGTFSGAKVPGMGVVAALLVKEGIRVFSEHELDKAEAYLKKLETKTHKT